MVAEVVEMTVVIRRRREKKVDIVAGFGLMAVSVWGFMKGEKVCAYITRCAF